MVYLDWNVTLSGGYCAHTSVYLSWWVNITIVSSVYCQCLVTKFTDKLPYLHYPFILHFYRCSIQRTILIKWIPTLMNAHRDSGGIDPLNLNLGTRQRWEVTFWSGCFIPGTQWIGGQVGPEASLDILEKGEVSCLCCELNPGLSTHNWLLNVGISGLKFKVHGDHTLCNPWSVSLKWLHSRVPPAAPPLAACSLQLCSPQFSPQDLVSLAFHTLDPHQWNLQHMK